jgi:hypothetical protein
MRLREDDNPSASTGLVEQGTGSQQLQVQASAVLTEVAARTILVARFLC